MEVTHEMISFKKKKYENSKKEILEKITTIDFIFEVIGNKIRSVISRWRPGETIATIKINKSIFKIYRDKKLFSFNTTILWVLNEKEISVTEFYVNNGVNVYIGLIDSLYDYLPEIIQGISKEECCIDLGIAEFFDDQ